MNSSALQPPVVLQTGFRIFFLGALFYAIFSMVFWFYFYVAGGNIFVAMPLTVWHGYEMVYGFTMAVVAGFLLTAVTNWTGLPTASGRPLLILFLLWVMGRVLAFFPSAVPIWPKALCDIAFMAFLFSIVLKPIMTVKQWQQSAVLSKVVLVLLSGVLFYLGLQMSDLVVERKALRLAVYMIVSLIFTIARRIMPFFIERGVGYPVTLSNDRFLDITSLVLLIAFAVADIVLPFPWIVAVIAALLAIVHALRLKGWHTPGIWQKPLLWVLFLGYIFLIVGFVLKVFAIVGNRPDDACLHAFTAGGIGLFTLGMMARVSWGHTGRNVGQPPKQLSLIFILLTLAAVVRVFFPLIDEVHYIAFIGLSQVLWLCSYIIFACVYVNVLISPRPDGRLG